MSRNNKPNSAIAVIGIDTGKNSFHIVGHDQRGAIMLQEKWSRGQMGNTACQPAAVPDRHGGLRRRAYLSRKLQMLGHDARPDAGVRPYFEETEEDFRDAKAIAEPCSA